MHTNKKKDNKYLLKEAELIINNCMRDSRKEDVFDNMQKNKSTAEIRNTSINIVINAILICSIAVLIYIISKII